MYENKYRTKICNFTVGQRVHMYILNVKKRREVDLAQIVLDHSTMTRERVQTILRYLLLQATFWICDLRAARHLWMLCGTEEVRLILWYPANFSFSQDNFVLNFTQKLLQILFKGPCQCQLAVTQSSGLSFKKKKKTSDLDNHSRRVDQRQNKEKCKEERNSRDEVVLVVVWIRVILQKATISVEHRLKKWFFSTNEEKANLPPATTGKQGSENNSKLVSSSPSSALDNPELKKSSKSSTFFPKISIALVLLGGGGGGGACFFFFSLGIA